MSKRSFLRGFGIGVLFATVILGISGLMRTSDAAVVKRAKQLGMDYIQEEPLLVRNKPASSAAVGRGAGAQKASDSPEGSAKPKVKKSKATEKPAKVVSQEEADKEDLEKEKSKIRKDYEKAVRSFTIKEGEWSDSVSRNLERAGIVADASEFDDYLEKHGYSDDIIAGEFQISSDADYEEIAKSITGK